ncbi:MAG TPA: DUF5719 family protein [Intrasporangium sp.]|uniref:DUF5719 family protein n=1 Tax=Intrasporangium sp. TaxID=1925024 RepID=UPI002B4A58B6|nr:DUF5719 family protein [Intrasporangium sp.]HKX68653.1 DUF5719 family protein [Intrasporangium sp.]
MNVPRRQGPPDGEPPSPTARGRWLRTRPALIRPALIALAAAGLAIGATSAEGTVELAAPSERAGLPQASQVLVESAALVCPGQQRVGTQGMRDVAGIVHVAAAAAPEAALAGLPRATPEPGQVSLLDPGRRTMASTDQRFESVAGPGDGSAPVVVSGEGALAPGLAATQSWLHTGDDDRGFALTPCLEPSADVWLVGGGGGASRTERVVITNPGANAVSVAVEVFGAEGPVDASERTAVSVPPASRLSISLDALAPDELRPGVHVIATGGVVSAVLNDAWIDGATARGADDATAAAAPARDLVVAGLEAAPAGQGELVLRLVNPGDAEALARVTLLTARGPVQPAGLRAVRVGAGSTLDVPLTLAAGSSGLRIMSDSALTAAVLSDRRQATGEDREGDFGWAPALPPIAVTGGVVLPGPVRAGETRTLHLVAGPTGGEVTTTLGTGDSERSITTRVDALTAVSIPLGAADRIWTSTTARDVRAAVTVAFADGGVPYYSIVPVPSAPTTETAVPVRQVTS